MKTYELTGAALDWAVTRAHQEGEPAFDYYIDHKGRVMEERGDLSWHYSPSTNWAHGGPIIDREKISTIEEANGLWLGSIGGCTDLDMPLWQEHGPTPLIAAMRCYVTSKLGDDIDVPEELK